MAYTGVLLDYIYTQLGYTLAHMDNNIGSVSLLNTPSESKNAVPKDVIVLRGASLTDNKVYILAHLEVSTTLEVTYTLIVHTAGKDTIRKMKKQVSGFKETLDNFYRVVDKDILPVIEKEIRQFTQLRGLERFNKATSRDLNYKYYSQFMLYVASGQKIQLDLAVAHGNKGVFKGLAKKALSS